MKLLIAACVVGALVAGFSFAMNQDKSKVLPTPPAPAGSKIIVVAGGCFWCIDGMYRQLKGVLQVESGYAGGNRPNPTYDQVCSGVTGHAEVVRVVYDPKEVSGEDLLRIFFAVHDPTTMNRQGPDEGTQYRSALFYADDEQKKLYEKVRAEIAAEKIWDDPIVTTIEPLKNYSRAEEYHQDYFAKYEKASAVERATMNAGYCNAVVAPKVAKFRSKYASKLKKG